MILFRLIDATGRRIHLTQERWRHIRGGHPALGDDFILLETALRMPSAVRRSYNDENVRIYYLHCKRRKEGKYLAVVVKYLNSSGYVITAFYADKIGGRK